MICITTFYYLNHFQYIYIYMLTRASLHVSPLIPITYIFQLWHLLSFFFIIYVFLDLFCVFRYFKAHSIMSLLWFHGKTHEETCWHLNAFNSCLTWFKRRRHIYFRIFRHLSWWLSAQLLTIACLVFFLQRFLIILVGQPIWR